MKFEKILVTGSSGFLGSYVAETLSSKGYKVVLFDKYPSPYKTDDQEEIVGDILNLEDVAKAVKGCSAVYQAFAAQADIEASAEDPKFTLEINILGTQRLLQMAVKNNVKRFMFASTIYVYSDLGSFYRVSKQACEKIIEEYQENLI